jgi:macrolide-specific efflux system membrane fusion protein
LTPHRDGRSWRRSIHLFALGLIAVAAGFLAVSQIGTPTTAARTTTELVTAENGVVQTTVSGTGNVQAGTDDDVDFATSGTLEHVYVHEGEHVTKGQILATLDPTSAQLTLDQANATLTAARDTLDAAEDPSSTTATSTTTTTDAATLDSDEIAVESDEQTVKTDQLAVAETTLRAPASGTIASLEQLFPGSQVSAGTSSSASSTSSSASTSDSSSSTGSSTSGDSSSSSFAEIINTDTLTMTVAFSEGDIGEIKVGQPATVTIDALTGVELAGEVAAISPTATESDSVVSYDVTLNLDQTDSEVLSGMSASATVIVDQAAGVTLPNDAVSGSGSESTVTLDQDGKRVERQVVVGLRGTSRTQIASGVQSGDQVVVTETLPSLGSSSSTTSSSRGAGGAPTAGGAAP